MHAAARGSPVIFLALFRCNQIRINSYALDGLE